MIDAIKKLFIWTPRDVAAWEKFRQPGMHHFVLWYGLAGFGGVLFVITALISLIGWFRAPTGGESLLNEVGVDAAVCLLGGLLTGLLTWWLEDGIYWRIIKSSQL